MGKGAGKVWGLRLLHFGVMPPYQRGVPPKWNGMGKRLNARLEKETDMPKLPSCQLAARGATPCYIYSTPGNTDRSMDLQRTHWKILVGGSSRVGAVTKQSDTW